MNETQRLSARGSSDTGLFFNSDVASARLAFNAETMAAFVANCAFGSSFWLPSGF